MKKNIGSPSFLGLVWSWIEFIVKIKTHCDPLVNVLSLILQET